MSLFSLRHLRAGSNALPGSSDRAVNMCLKSTFLPSDWLFAKQTFVFSTLLYILINPLNICLPSSGVVTVTLVEKSPVPILVEAATLNV